MFLCSLSSFALLEKMLLPIMVKLQLLMMAKTLKTFTAKFSKKLHACICRLENASKN